MVQNEATTAQEKLSAARRRHAKAARIRRPHVGEIMLEKENKREADFRKEILFVTFNGIILQPKLREELMTRLNGSN